MSDARAAALEAVYAVVTTTERRRTPVEAVLANTNAYVAYEFAYGFARIGRESRARALMGAARLGLRQVITDPVHAWLTAAFEVRIEQAIAGVLPGTAIPDLDARLVVQLDRVARYKVDIARQRVKTLDPRELDAIAIFSARDPRQLGALPTTLASRFRALRRANDRVGVRKLVDEIGEPAPSFTPFAMGFRLSQVKDRVDGITTALVWAAALRWLGEDERARPMLEATTQLLAVALPIEIRLEIERFHALALGTSERGLARIVEHAATIASITDSWGTNSHYAVSVLDFVDGLVLGTIADP